MEFDSNPKVKIEPSNFIQKRNVPKYCVISFFAEVIKWMLHNDWLKQVAILNSETVSFPIYETVYDGQSIAIVQGFVGSAGLLEELIAMGFTNFIVCGAAGVLQKNIQVGHLIVPFSAVRDKVCLATVLAESLFAPTIGTITYVPWSALCGEYQLTESGARVTKYHICCVRMQIIKK